jgi:hypothetical protein
LKASVDNLGHDHPDTLRTFIYFARILARAGDTAGAKAILEDVLWRLQKVLGENHASTQQAAQELQGLH